MRSNSFDQTPLQQSTSNCLVLFLIALGSLCIFPNPAFTHGGHDIWEDLGEDAREYQDFQYPYTATLNHREYPTSRRQLMALKITDEYSQPVKEFTVEINLVSQSDENTSKTLFPYFLDDYPGIIELRPLIGDNSAYTMNVRFSDLLQTYNFAFSDLKVAEEAPANIAAKLNQESPSNQKKNYTGVILIALFGVAILGGLILFIRK